MGDDAECCNWPSPNHSRSREGKKGREELRHIRNSLAIYSPLIGQCLLTNLPLIIAPLGE
jgi:hypothetical protein